VVSVLWAGGRLRDPREPVLSGADAGFATGLGVFETCAVAAGRAFALTRHLDRLAASLRALDLPPVDEGEVRDAVAAVLAAGGADVGRVPWVRNERSPLAGHKSTSYAADVLALAAAQRAGGNEAVLANTRGELCEGTGSNVFVERDGALLTPPLSSGCLPGVTRALALEWAAEAGLPVAEARSGELPWEVLDDVRRGGASLALSGSLRGFVGVHALDGAAVATGPLTAAVAELFRARAGADPDP
jgi:branched-chain amino acid aminotransferase